MNHEERRTTLQRQHLELRSLIAQVRTVAVAVLDGAAPDELRTRIGDLTTDLQAHMATEEALLGPILERIDAWGPVRLDLMRAEHAHQRGVMSLLRSRGAGALPPEALARRTIQLLEEILADMDAEDRDILDAKVLRDDLIQLDASDC
jgi:iron-sulfur cluster repair protein YtfE (RIC family)